MPRAKGGPKTRRRRKGILKQASSYRGGRSRLIRTATEAVRRAMRTATRHRKLRKRDFRSLWITRLGIAAREHGISYSQLMGRFAKAKIGLNRKMLSELAIHNPKGFGELVQSVK